MADSNPPRKHCCEGAFSAETLRKFLAKTNMDGESPPVLIQGQTDNFLYVEMYCASA